MDIEKPEDIESKFWKLMEIEDTSVFSTENALGYLGALIDLSGDLSNEAGLNRAICVGNEILTSNLPALDRATCHYFLGNAHSSLGRLRGNHNEYQWDQEEVEKEILNLRYALKYSENSDVPDNILRQVYTNMGNNFKHVGRLSEAIPYWKKAIDLNPTFAMAIGGVGNGLFKYAETLYDEGYKQIFASQSHQFLSEALEIHDDPHFYPNARDGFAYTKQWLEDRVDKDILENDWGMDSFSLGESSDEVQYRKWCLQNTLFLNNLNDLGPYSICACDTLVLPTFTTRLDKGKSSIGHDEEPYFLSFFNQMKQEFVSARFLFYEGTEASHSDIHYSDKDVKLRDTLDSPSYCLAAEKVKASFRIAYSIFDKIACFLNKYHQLEIPDNKVYFRDIWYNVKKQGRRPDEKHGVRDVFQKNENIPLRGLFWLSKDLVKEDDEFSESIEPDAQKLKEIRNHIEHKDFKLIDSFGLEDSTESECSDEFIADSLTYQINRNDFEKKCLKLLKLSRAALIYLCLSVHCEEKRRNKDNGEMKCQKMPFRELEDDMKI